MTAPAKSDPAVARARFERDMGIVGANPRTREWGWVLDPDYDGLRLYAKMWALDEQHNRLDAYYIDMDMSYYPGYPPGVTFVNPETGSFVPNADMMWLPKWGAVLPPRTKACFALNPNSPEYEKIQLVRNTMVLDFYLAGCVASPSEAWNPDRNTFFATLHVLQQILTRPCYEGRSQ